MWDGGLSSGINSLPHAVKIVFLALSDSLHAAESLCGWPNVRGSIKINHGGRQRGESEANNAGWCVKRIWSRQRRNIFAVNCPLFCWLYARMACAVIFDFGIFESQAVWKVVEKGKELRVLFWPAPGPAH